MTKYVVGFSLSTLASAAIIVGFAVVTICATMVISSYHPEPSWQPRVVTPRKVTTPIQIQPQGSVGATKEAQLEAQFGRVDTSKTHEVKEGFFDRFRRARQTTYVSHTVTRRTCPNCQGTQYRQPIYQPAPYSPAPEPMPQIDPSTLVDGSVALKDVNPFAFTSPLVAPSTCPNCRKAPTIFGN